MLFTSLVGDLYRESNVMHNKIFFRQVNNNGGLSHRGYDTRASCSGGDCPIAFTTLEDSPIALTTPERHALEGTAHRVNNTGGLSHGVNNVRASCSGGDCPIALTTLEDPPMALTTFVRHAPEGTVPFR